MKRQLTFGPLRRFGWRVRSVLAPRPRILAYHRVTRLDRDPYELAICPEEFEKHLQLLRSHYRPVSLAALLAALADRSVPANSVVLTFDDGYADSIDVVLPLLEKFETPATFFIVAGAVGSDREFWWDELEQIVFDGTSSAPLVFRASDGQQFSWASESDALETRRALCAALHAFLLPLGCAERDRLLQEVRRSRRVPARLRPSHRVLDEAGLRQLAAHPLVQIGCHTLTHPSLGGLSVEDQRHEIHESRQRLQGLLGTTITSFAYPFGYEGSWNAASQNAVRAAGFESACTTYWRPVTRNTSPFELPRLMVGSWSAERLRSVLQRVG